MLGCPGEAYRERNRKGLTYGEADNVCLSYTHDPATRPNKAGLRTPDRTQPSTAQDYKKLMPKKFQYHMKPGCVRVSFSFSSLLEEVTVRRV